MLRNEELFIEIKTKLRESYGLLNGKQNYCKDIFTLPYSLLDQMKEDNVPDLPSPYHAGEQSSSKNRKAKKFVFPKSFSRPKTAASQSHLSFNVLKSPQSTATGFHTIKGDISQSPTQRSNAKFFKSVSPRKDDLFATRSTFATDNTAIYSKNFDFLTGVKKNYQLLIQ